MKKFKPLLLTITLAWMLAGGLPAVNTASGSLGLGVPVAAAADQQSGMERVRLILKKLRDAMGSMKDFDELEEAGMPKKDVDRMRHAMETKIKQMMDDALQAIQSL